MDKSFRKLAVLDVDDTLFDGNMGKTLLKSVIFNRKYFHLATTGKILTSLLKNKVKYTDKDEMVQELIDIVPEMLRGVEQQAIEQIASGVWSKVKGKLHPFAHILIPTLKQNGFHPLLLTGSLTEITNCLAKDLGVEEYIASTLATKGGKYTGEIDHAPVLPGQKAALLKNYETEMNTRGREILWSDSIALGNPCDVEVFSMVGRAFIIDPENSYHIPSEREGKWHLVDPNTIVPVFQTACIG